MPTNSCKRLIYATEELEAPATSYDIPIIVCFSGIKSAWIWILIYTASGYLPLLSGTQNFCPNEKKSAGMPFGECS